jgi:hypothetical protein
MPDVSRITIIGALVTMALFALAAVLFVADSSAANERLGLFFALAGAIVTGLIAALRADQAAVNTNGKLDARIQAAVHRANAARRNGDPPPGAGGPIG